MCPPLPGCFYIEPLAPISQLVVHPEPQVQDPLLSILSIGADHWYHCYSRTCLVQLFESLPQGHCQQQHKITTPGCQHSQCCPVAPTKTSDQCPQSMSQSSFFLHHCVRVRVGGGHLKPIRFPSTLHVSLCTHQLLLQGLNL